MDWPAPTPPESDTTFEPRRPDDPESAEDRRRLSAVPAAAWIALLGSALVLAAAIAVVASNWSAIGQTFRVAGLAVATGGLLVLAHRMRPVVPTTAGIIAHVGTFLTASVGIATMSLFGFTWPLCLAVGGGALIAATELQAVGWRRETMHLGQVAGFAMAATGVAALAGTTAGFVAVIASVGLLVVGAQRRSGSLALLAVLSPALTALADAGIGSGTLARAGLVGERLSWSGPVVGLLAATVIGAIALDRRNNPLMLVAAASPIIGIVTGLAAVDGSAVAWWSVPALVLIVAELAVWLLPSDRFRTQIINVVTAGAGVLAGLTWTAPALVTLDLFDSGLASPWAVPVALTTVALAITTQRWWIADSSMVDVGLAAVGAGAIGLFGAFDAPTTVIAAVALAVTIGAAVLSRRLSALAIHPTAFWSLVAILAVGDEFDGTGSTAVALGLLGALVVVVLAARARIAAGNGPLGWVEMTGVAVSATLGALVVTASNGPAVALGAMGAIAVIAVLIEQRHTVWAVAIVAATGIIALDAASSTGTLDETYAFGWFAVTTAFTVLWLVQRSSIMSYAAASAATIAIATTAPLFDISAADFTVMTMLAVVALTGVAYTWERRTPLDAAALTAGGLLLVTPTLGIDPVWSSGAWTLVGLQVMIVGLAVARGLVLSGGAAIAAGGVISMWFTSGLNDWFVDAIGPADIRVTDLWFAAVSVAALLAGLTLRSTLGVSSWVAYSAAHTIAGLWLTSVHLERHPVWAVPLLLTVGVLAAGVGAWRRLGAPLVGGTVLTTLGVFLATESDITAVPIWTWLALGGAALLGTAVLIERAGAVGTAGLAELVDRWR